MKAFLSIALIVTAAVLFWVFNPAKGKTVEVVTAQTAPAVQAVYATGTVEAVKMVSISPKTPARIVSLSVDEGMKVEAGQILADMENADAKESVNQLQAAYDQAQKDLARAERLSKSGAISKESLDQARTAMKTANANLERGKVELGYLQLTAPESGTIIRRDGEIGETIALGTPVFWLNAGDQLRIETEVDEEDISLIRTGQDVVIGADAFPGQIFHGKVSAITPKGDSVARSYRVRISMPQDTPLMIGMTAETNILTNKKDAALLVPAAAVKDNQVIKIGQGKAESIGVITGIKTQREIEITGGIGKDDHIAAVYDAALAEGGKIKTKTVKWSVAQGK